MLTNARIVDAFGTREERKSAMAFVVSDDDQIYAGQCFVHPERERNGEKFFNVEIRVPIGKDKLPMDAEPFSFDLGNENMLGIGWAFTDEDGKGSVILPNSIYLTYEDAKNALRSGSVARKFHMEKDNAY